MGQSRIENLLENVLGAENIVDPQSRIEAILYAMATGESKIGEPYSDPPKSRIEVLLVDVFEKSGDLWNADELTQTNTPGIQRYGVTLEGGHTYIIVNNAYAGYGGSRDNRTCYWWDEGGGIVNGQLLAADGRTQAAVLTPSGTFHIWVGSTPSPFFHVYKFDM